FRGWSGSARDHVAVRADEATPGYLPGPLAPGLWSVLLGLYQVPEPCTLEVTVEVDAEASAASLDEGAATISAARAGPVPPARRMLDMVAGDLHTHTVHSADAEHPIGV